MQTSDSIASIPEAGSEAERSTLLLTYVLHALGPFTGALTGLIAVIISHIKVRETQSEFIRSHHSWLIRTFWWAVLWVAISYVLMIVVVGFFTYGVLALWWLYRTIRGFIHYNEKKPMPG